MHAFNRLMVHSVETIWTWTHVESIFDWHVGNSVGASWLLK